MGKQPIDAAPEAGRHLNTRLLPFRVEAGLPELPVGHRPVSNWKIGIGRDAADVAFITAFGDAPFNAQPAAVRREE